jgi:anti-sigma regulatory factor (Ser/Thr protein kinase)
LRTAERTHEIRLSVPADPTSLGVVRRAVQGFRDLCGQEATDRLAMILSEIVTNAIRHAGLTRESTLEVVVEAGDGGMFGRVVDPGRGFDPKALPDRPLHEGGFGLRIVDKLAQRWGVNRNGRTEVWFEL